jgi:hypothetical protein
MKLSLNILFILSCMVFVVATSHAAESGNLNEFEMVSPAIGGLSITFRSVGPRFMYQINQGPRQTSDYGDTMLIPSGKSATLMTTNLSILISPIGQDGQAWIITKKTDLRPQGGALTHECFKINTSTGSIVFEDSHMAR